MSLFVQVKDANTYNVVINSLHVNVPFLYSLKTTNSQLDFPIENIV